MCKSTWNVDALKEYYYYILIEAPLLGIPGIIFFKDGMIFDLHCVKKFIFRGRFKNHGTAEGVRKKIIISPRAGVTSTRKSCRSDVYEALNLAAA